MTYWKVKDENKSQRRNGRRFLLDNELTGKPINIMLADALRSQIGKRFDQKFLKLPLVPNLRITDEPTWRCPQNPFIGALVTAVSRSHLDLGLKKNFPSSRSPTIQEIETKIKKSRKKKLRTNASSAVGNTPRNRKRKKQDEKHISKTLTACPTNR